MAGHSHAANVARRKAAVAAVKGKLFTKLIKEIMVAARVGGGDPSANPRLRLALDKARANSVPRDTIERAVAKGSGNVDMSEYESLMMEGYAPGGIAVMVSVLTDNRNRSASEVRNAFTKAGGALGTPGCVQYMFKQKGVILVPADGVDEDELTMAAADAGADDISRADDTFEVVTSPEAFDAVRDALAATYAVGEADVRWIPDAWVAIAGEDVEAYEDLLERLDDCDDVQDVYTNAELPG